MQNEPRYQAGEAIKFQCAGSTGHSTNHLGLGDLSISLMRDDGKGVWVDMLRIYFSQASEEQWLECLTDPKYASEAAKAVSQHQRSLSFKQAKYLEKFISDAIKEKFNGHFPSDQDIDEMEK